MWLFPSMDDIPPEWGQPRRAPTTSEERPPAKRHCYPRPAPQPAAPPPPAKKPLRDAILQCLEPTTDVDPPVEMLEVDSLICRLPYKKMLKALCSPESTMANIPYVTRAYEVSPCPILGLSLDQSVIDLMLVL